MRTFKFKTLDSTNENLKNKRSIEQWDTVIAEIQTAGKGRRGNEWVSPKGAALFSFALKVDKQLNEKDYSVLPLIAGRALVEALKNIEDLDYKFKWPNDIYLNDKKISGILIEKVGEFYVIGMGININNIEFGEGNHGISLREVTGKEYKLEEVIKMAIMIFKKTWARYIRGQWERILSEIDQIDYLKGKTIQIDDGKSVVECIATKILEDGKLEVNRNGELEEYLSGEIHIKK